MVGWCTSSTHAANSRAPWRVHTSLLLTLQTCRCDVLHPRSTLLHGCTQGRPCYNGWGLAGSEAAAAALHQLRWLASASLALHQHPPAGSNVRLPNRREGGCCVAVPTLSPRPRHRFLGTWKAGQIPGSQGPHGHAWHVVRVSVLFLCCSETPHPLDIIRKPCCYY